jgi:hypothetical protein
MAERTFKIIQRFWNRVPSMSTCTGCNYKFFAPSPLQHDSERAEIYLEEKYGLHRCSLEQLVQGLTDAGCSGTRFVAGMSGTTVAVSKPVKQVLGTGRLRGSAAAARA